MHAGKAAYAEAGITNPREEISMAQVHDCFSITEAVTMEDLEFSPRGKVKDDIDSGFFDLTGGLPVQTDGGLKSFGHPIGATGLRMMYETYKQLQGKCGDRQLKVDLDLPGVQRARRRRPSRVARDRAARRARCSPGTGRAARAPAGPDGRWSQVERGK